MKKRMLSMLLVLVMLLGMMPFGVLAADEVTEVSDQAGLAAMGSGSYRLTSDITLSGWTELSGFSGTLDGNGYTITLDGRPLFSTMSGTVKNLILAGTVSESANKNTGALAQSCSGTIRNCISTADVTFTGSSPYVYIGGLSGKVTGTIANCLITGTLSNSSALCYGAVSNIALFESGTIKNCVAIGDRIASTETWTGGDPFAGTNCTLIADAASFVPGDYVDAFNANRETGDVEWAVVDGVMTLMTVEAAPEADATAEELAALETAIAVAEAVDTAKVYTAETWAAYTAALETANTVLNGEAPKQSKVLTATEALNAAVAALAERSLEAVDLSDKDVISITTADELEYMQDGKYYRLDADITLGQYWFGYFNTMNSVLDGNGHTITLIGKPLWSAIGPNGVIQNLGVIGTAQNNTNDTGAFAQNCQGLIVNCWSRAEVSSAGQNNQIKNTGGFVANLKSGGAIVNSYVAGSVAAAGSSGTAGVGALAGTSETNTMVLNGYWLNTVNENAVGAASGTVSGSSPKTREEFYGDSFLATLNAGKGVSGRTWTINDGGWPHLGTAGSFVPPQPVELQYTAYPGYGSGSTTFTDTKGLLLSLAEVLPDPDAEVSYYVGYLSYPGYAGEIEWQGQYVADGQGNHKVFVSAEGEIQVLGAGYLDIVAYDKNTWEKLAAFTITVSDIQAEEIRLIPSGEYVTENEDGTYTVEGSGTVTVNVEIKVDGQWKSAPASLFSFATDGKVFGTDSSTFYATEPGTITVTASGLEQTASVTVVSTYVPVTSIAPAPSGTYVIHGRDANSEGSGDFLDLTLAHGAGTVVVQPANASYRTSWSLTSSDPEVADFSTNYMMAVVPYKAGTVTLTATSNDPNLTAPIAGTSTITLVYFNPLTSVEMTELNLSVKENETIELPLTFNGDKNAEGYHVSEPGMIWTFSGDGEVEITRSPLGVIVGAEGSKEYCIANSTYKLTGNAYGTVTVTGIPVDRTGGAQPITFTVTVEPGEPETPADTDKIVAEGIEKATAYLENAYKGWNYQYGDEWAVFMLMRTGAGLTEEQIAYYLDTVAEAYAGPKAAELKPTTIARVILAVSAVGGDATDLVELLCTSDSITAGSNEAIWALIALDCMDYQVPENAPWTREALIAEILTYQNAENGGFGLNGSDEPDIDMTAMAIQALAPYYAENETVKAAVDAALAYLRSKMDRNCDFGSSEATAQVLIALSVLGKDPLDTENGFVKSVARNLITAMEAYASGSGYKHLMTDETANGMGTLQALMAYEAYARFAAGEDALYDLNGSDADAGPGETEKPTTPADPQKPGNAPDTGDDANLALWSGMMVVSLLAIAALVISGKNRYTA